jgi:hypothetical protein
LLKEPTMNEPTPSPVPVYSQTSVEARNGERRYERWQEANARSDRRREKLAKIALAVMLAGMSAWTVFQVLR